MKFTQTAKPSNDPQFIFISEKGVQGRYYPSLAKTTIRRIKKAFEQKMFTGKAEETLQLIDENIQTFLIGTGKNKDAKELQKSGGTSVRIMQDKKLNNSQFVIGDDLDKKNILFGALLADYQFKISTEDSKQKSITTIKIISETKLDKQEWNDVRAIASGVNLTRQMVNLPPNLMMPSDIVKQAQALGKTWKHIKVKVIDEKQAKKLGMGALLAVGQGSSEECALIVLEYMGGNKKDAPAAFIGKGVSFDSGGYNLKPSGAIMDMKMDMGGAATVCGLFEWIGATEPKQNIIGAIPTVENMVSANAYRPGDIITAMNGKTIEIGNTDAEGRLILADALHYTATNYKPASMIDLATLTGAVIGALGYEITGVMGNHKKTVKNILEASVRANEDAWELPITETFRKAVKNDISDLKNIDRATAAGSSVAGAFLEEFVGDTPWAHLDIAGTAFGSKASSICPKGATGAMTQTLIEYVKGMS